MGFAVAKSEPQDEPVSLAEAKAQCEVDHDDRDDWFEDRIPAARQKVEESNRVFAECDVVLELDDFPRLAKDFTDGQPAIRLPLWPVGSVEAVKYYAADGTLTTLVAGTDYLTFLSRVPSLIYPAPGKTWPTVQFGRLGAVIVEHTAAADPKLPMAKTAMLDLIDYWWERDQRNEAVDGVPPAAASIINGLTRPMYT